MSEAEKRENPIIEAFRKLGVEENQLGQQKGPYFAQVLKAHTILEAALTGALRITVASPEHFDKLRLKYAQMVHLGLALGAVPEEFGPFLFKLEGFRNRLAHEVGADVSRDDVRVLVRTLPVRFGALIDATEKVVGSVIDPLAFVTLMMATQLAGEETRDAKQ